MPRYIDAEKIGYCCNPECEGKCDKCRKDDRIVSEESIEQIPTADVQEVIHAHWTTKRTQSHDGETYCSHCDAELPYVVTRMSTVDHPYPEIEYIDEPNYCPNCGAKMDSGQ